MSTETLKPIDMFETIGPPAVKQNIPVVEKIREDLQKDNPVPERTIIRWTSVHPSNGAEFHYAAVFAGGAWYTSAHADNQNVQRIMQHEDLIAYFNKKKKNLVNIEIAVDFVSLDW